MFEIGEKALAIPPVVVMICLRYGQPDVSCRKHYTKLAAEKVIKKEILGLTVGLKVPIIISCPFRRRFSETGFFIGKIKWII